MATEIKKNFEIYFLPEAKAFIDKLPHLVIATNGFIKKSRKTPDKEISRAESLMKKYYEEK